MSRSAASQPWKELLVPSGFLGLALAMAILSAMARRDGLAYSSTLLATLSLLMAFVVGVTLVPRVLIRLRLEKWSHLQFFRVTRRGIFFFFLITIVAVASANTNNNLLILVLSFLLASLVASEVVSNLMLNGLRATLTPPSFSHAGQKVPLYLSLANGKTVFPSLALQLGSPEGGRKDQGPFVVERRHLPYLGPKERYRLSLSAHFKKRGVYRIDTLEIATSFPFGFFARGRRLESSEEVVVYPELKDLTRLFTRYPHLPGILESHLKGQGTSVHTIREYRTGDSARQVHWKSTAKVGRLMVKDFARDDEVALDLVFSTYLPDLSLHQQTRFEKAVCWVASLGHYYWERGQRFRFFSGESDLQVGNREEYHAFMAYLAQVRPSPKPLLGRYFSPRPLVLFTAGEGGDWGTAFRIDYLREEL